MRQDSFYYRITEEAATPNIKQQHQQLKQQQQQLKQQQQQLKQQQQHQISSHNISNKNSSSNNWSSINNNWSNSNNNWSSNTEYQTTTAATDHIKLQQQQQQQHQQQLQQQQLQQQQHLNLYLGHLVPRGGGILSIETLTFYLNYILVFLFFILLYTYVLHLNTRSCPHKPFLSSLACVALFNLQSKHLHLPCRLTQKTIMSPGLVVKGGDS